MKRITAVIGAVAAAAMIGGTAVFAAGPGYGAAGYGYGSGGNCQGSAGLAGQSTRVCEYCEQYGGHYTDSDGDGICDHYQAMTEGNTVGGSGQGRHLSGHRGEHWGGHQGERAGGHHQAECIWR